MRKTGYFFLLSRLFLLLITSISAQVPQAPVIQNISNISAISVEVSWQDTSTNEEGFYIYYSSNITAPSLPALTNAPGSTSVIISNLIPGTAWYFWLEAYNSYGVSGRDTGFTVTPGISVPAAPGGFYSIETGTNYFVLSWILDTNADAYNLYYSTINVQPFSPAFIIPGGIFNYSVSNLDINTTYFFWLTASNYWGESSTAVYAGYTDPPPVTNPPAPPPTGGSTYLGEEPPYDAMTGLNSFILRSTVIDLETEDSFELVYDFTEDELVRVRLYNMAGALVRRFDSLQEKISGYYSLEMDLRDDGGLLLTRGRYVLVLQSNRRTDRIVLVLR